MRFIRATIIFIICIIIFSIFIANVTNLINIDYSLKTSDNDNVNMDFNKNDNKLKLTDTADHLMWFLQISDLHISIFQDKQRITQLQEFVTKTIDAIKPTVVLASGDLTDAKTSDLLGSKQFKKEWEIYYNILNESNIIEKTIWLDIRGNHDNFNVPVKDSLVNYFTNYSMQGRFHKKSYLYEVKRNSDIYTFIGIDASLEPGPKRPFNFIGIINKDDLISIIANINNRTNLNKNYNNHKVWFGHYPTSCIASPNNNELNIRNVISRYDDSYVYLCGHLHTLGGLVPNMYTLQKNGFLELELGDWKDNRIYRLAAFDHGLFSFIDVKHNEWPIILITNPKKPLYNIPKHENNFLQETSTHIRLLIFSLSNINECNIRINNKKWETCVQKSKNLFVLKWEPSLYKYNKNSYNTIEVYVRDNDGREKFLNEHFSLNDIINKYINNYGLLQRFVLMTDACQIFIILYILALSVCILPLIMLKIWHLLIKSGKIKKSPHTKLKYFNKQLRKYWLLSSVNCIFYPLVLYCLYLTCGPWSIGDVVDDHLGIVFLWGIFVNGTFLPGSLTYLYGFFQLTFCQLPLIIIFSNCIEHKFQQFNNSNMKLNNDNKTNTIYYKIFNNLPFLLIMVVELILAYYFWQAYGTIAFLIGPLRTWSIVINVYLFYKCKTLNITALKSGMEVWSK